MKTVLISLALRASAFANEAVDEDANREAFTGVATRAAVQSDDLHARKPARSP